jgi:serine protease DegQ
LPQKDGVIVAGIVKDGPADKAGLKVGDILLKLDNKKISDTTQMLNQIAAYAPGEKKAIELLREGKPQTLTIEIGIRPKPGAFIKRQ